MEDELIFAFKIFIGFLLLLLFLFLLVYTGHEYECTLPNGGYCKIRWNEKLHKLDFLYWQQKTKSKSRPHNVIKLEGERDNSQ